MTQLHKVMYVVCAESSIIQTYNADTLEPFGEGIHVEGMKDPCDVVVCRDNRQLYIADDECRIWRVSADDHSDQEKWLPTESTTDTFHVNKLSVTSRRLLVTSHWPPRLQEYSTTERQLLRVVQLPWNVWSLYHGVETARGTFVIGHEGTSKDKRQHAVSKLILINHAMLH